MSEKPHTCDENCVCADHGTPLIYWPAGDDHACQDVRCRFGHGVNAVEVAPFPFPLAEPMPEPVLLTRPCGCTSMITEPDRPPIQFSWCDQHDPGYESEGKQ